MSKPHAAHASTASAPKVAPTVGETWRGYNHGSLLKVTAVDGQHVHALWVYTGNPYYADRVGTVGRFGLEGWTELCEYAPEWNEHGSRPGGA